MGVINPVSLTSPPPGPTCGPAGTHPEAESVATITTATQGKSQASRALPAALPRILLSNLPTFQQPKHFPRSPWGERGAGGEGGKARIPFSIRSSD